MAEIPYQLPDEEDLRHDAQEENPLITLALMDGVAERDKDGHLRIGDEYWKAVFTEMYMAAPSESMMEITKRAVARTKKEKGANG